MAYDRYIAIDWSGGKERLNTGIQVAEFAPANRTVSLMPSPERGSSGIWCRAEVLKQLKCWVKENRVLIGFDFAFAYPYCDEGEYFPCQPGSPINVRHLWNTVERICSTDGHFYGGRFYGVGSQFRDFYRVRDQQNQPIEGCHYQKKRYRATERKNIANGFRDPFSVFDCYGIGQVGTGSLAGMRFLRKVRKQTNARIWPFDQTNGHRSTLVEIYPTLFRAHAGISDNDEPNDETREKFRDCYGANLEYPRENWRSKDERDALVSAAGMAWFARQPETWQAPTLAAKYEGWIFGVR